MILMINADKILTHLNNHKNLRSILYVFAFLLPAAVLAQSDSTRTEIPLAKKCIVIEPAIRIGKIVKNFPDFPERGPAVLTEINIGQQCSGNKKWHQLYGYPTAGVSFIYGIMGNDDIIGRSISILPNLSFTTKKYRRWGFQWKAAMGFAFFTKKSDRVTNHENQLIGTTMTNMAMGSFDFRYDISKYYTILLGVSGIHYSDAHYQLPNIGINFPAVNLSLKYFPSGRPKLYKNDSLPDYSNKILFNIRLGFGANELGGSLHPTGGAKYPIYTGSLYLSKRYSRKNNVQLGVHINYHTGFYDFIIRQELYNSNQRLRAFTGQLFLGHEFVIGHFGLITQLGIYFYNPFFKKLQEIQNDTAGFNSWIKRYNSNKLGVNYYFMNPMKTTKNNVYIGLYLKSNFGQADFAEMSVGCAF
jgi:hypothetical protein